MEYVLEIENVSKFFHGLVAIDDLTIKVKPGQIYGIIGPNGAGKTTLFNCVTGIYKPEQGTIKYKGENIEDVAKKDPNYLNWMRNNMELDEDMQYTLNMVLKN